jgi:hypothetical protein
LDDVQGTIGTNSDAAAADDSVAFDFTGSGAIYDEEEAAHLMGFGDGALYAPEASHRGTGTVTGNLMSPGRLPELSLDEEEAAAMADTVM